MGNLRDLVDELHGSPWLKPGTDPAEADGHARAVRQKLQSVLDEM